MEPLLRVNNLQVDFVNETGSSTAVRDISFEINPGEILAIVGESGSGKSVTALSILQLLPEKMVRYRQGEILYSRDGLGSVNLLKLPQKDMRLIRGRQVSMIFQEPMTSLNPVFSCGQQVMEAIRIHERLSTRAARERCLELFDKVQLPDARSIFNRYPHQLSGGQKQRVMIAMAMSCGPALLICDEPTTALDVTVQKTILELIKALQASSKMAVLFITHDLGVVADIAHRCLVMHKGTIVEAGPVKEIFSNPKHPYTRGLLACRPALHPKGQRLPVVSDFWHQDESGSTLPKGKPEKAMPISPKSIQPGSGEVLLRVKDLSVWFPAKSSLFGKPLQFTRAVNNVSFDLFRNETLGLVGESGCGKTTLGRAILRLIEPTTGEIWYNGENLTNKRKSELNALRKEIQIVFQDPYSSLNPRIKIGDAIAEPIRVHRIIASARQRRNRTVELLENVGLTANHLNRYPHEFSGGQRQRIVIARALALNPSFLVCDESVSALDVSVQAQVLNLLNDLKQLYGFSILFISHDLSVVRYISDRIMVMNNGQIEETGDASEIYQRPASDYTRRLIAAIPGGSVQPA